MTLRELVTTAENIKVGDAIQVWLENRIIDYLTIDGLSLWATYRVSNRNVIKFCLYDNCDFANIHRVWIE